MCQKWKLARQSENSGCTSYMCKDEKNFFDSQKCKSEHKRNLASSLTLMTLNLNTTLYVSVLRPHLLSMEEICENGYEVSFKKSSAVIYDGNGIEKLYANRIDRFYYLQETSEIAINDVSESDHLKKFELWHRSLGHFNENDFKCLINTRGI